MPADDFNQRFICQTTYNEKEKIWSGSTIQPCFGPNCSVGEAILGALRKDPDHISQICVHNDKHYTNRQIIDLSIRAAVKFEKLGLKQCEMVGLLASNSDYLAPLFFGAMLCGLTVSALDPVLDGDVIKQTFGTTKPKVIFTDGSAFFKVKACVNSFKHNPLIYTMNDHINGVPNIAEFLEEIVLSEEYKPQPLAHGLHQVAVILRSSGTSGCPKLVNISHSSILNAWSFKMGPNDIILRYNTLYWISGLNRLIGATLQGATSVIMEKGFKAKMFPNILKKYKLTIMNSAPRLLAEILNLTGIEETDFSNLKRYYVGGCIVPYSLVEKAQMYMKQTEFYAVYGLSEIGGIVSCGEVTAAGHVGQLCPGLDVKIISENGHNSSIGEIGEICIKTVFPWAGYFGNFEATKKAYQDNWIYSADLGYFDKDNNLFVLERKKDIIKYKDTVVYPFEIEEIIARIPGVNDVCVCGVPDTEVGQKPAAVIVKDPDSSLTEGDIYDYLKGKLNDFQQLRGGIYFAEFIPKTLSGKSLRFRVADICEGLQNSK